MPNHSEIYQKEAEQYHRLISKQQSLYPVIETIKPVEGLDIIDMGAGSGRLASVLAPKAKSVLAIDEAEAMLKITKKRLEQLGLHNWNTAVADHRKLPVHDKSADLIVSGWSICYLASSNIEGWNDNIDQVMSEIKRVLRPGGAAVIIENFGTGSEIPCPPSYLKPYFELLENKYGFTSNWVRTDYKFESPQEAEKLIRFFFGDRLADKVAKDQMTQVPECAAVFSLHV